VELVGDGEEIAQVAKLDIHKVSFSQRP
jgi:hypothetical protein